MTFGTTLVLRPAQISLVIGAYTFTVQTYEEG